MDYGSGTIVKSGITCDLGRRPPNMAPDRNGTWSLTMNLFALPNLLPAPHRPQTLVQKLRELLTGSGDGWPEEVELQEIRDRGRGGPQSIPTARPPTPQTPPVTPPSTRRRRRRKRTPTRRSSDWEDLQLQGACYLTPPLGSPVLTPEEYWYPDPGDTPHPLSPCPGASPPLSQYTPECYMSPLLRDRDQRLPRPTPLPLPDTRPTLYEQKRALERALQQVSKDAFQCLVDVEADLNRFFGKLGIAPRQ
ncbi:E4 [Canis familiaris papillomavirus 18]|uniref:E4 n=1 Tax=Canis familiaris papillomavirus 18 TaxID=1816242 RepID=A0A3G1E4J7_9PAPI|nr:E4 [Canis familiaris papillomavirus 18]